MSKKELENKEIFYSQKRESFHDSQTESDLTNLNQNSPKREKINPIINNIKNEKNQKGQNEESVENIDHMAFDKKYWNNNEPFPELTLRKEATNESKFSIDTPDISKQRLKEYLNEDLLKALDVSPMTTPKNILKDVDTENNNDNNENIISINEEMIMNGSNNDLFQFSLYNNKNEKENNLNNKENNNIKRNPIEEIIKKTENIEDKNKYKNNKEEEDFNYNNIMESFDSLNLSLNNMQFISKSPNYNNKNKDKNINNINETKNIEEDEGGGANRINTKINNKNNSPHKEAIFTEKNNKKEKLEIDSTNNLKTNENLNKFEDNKQNTYKNIKNYIPSKIQQSYITHMRHFQYVNQQHLIALQPNIHENKFDGIKKFNFFIPIQPIKKNTKMKKPFEIREGDWTCSDCGNLNFSFRTKCNRCGISKDSSEQKMQKNLNNEKEQTNNIIRDNNINNGNNNINNSHNYYQNMMQYNGGGVIIHNPLYNKGETFFPKYYSGYFMVPVQGQYPKNSQDKMIKMENKLKNEELKKEKNKNEDKDKINVSNEEDQIIKKSKSNEI